MRQALRNEMEFMGYSYKELADRVKCSVGVLSKLMSGSSIRFDTVMDIVKLLLPEKRDELICLYAIESDKPSHLKCALEYASVNSNLELLRELIGKCQNHKNREMRDWGVYYNVLYRRLKGDIQNRDLMQEVISLQSNSVELNVLRTIMKMNYYYTIEDMSSLNKMSLKFMNSIDGVTDRFIKASFNVRHNQMLSYTKLYVSNDPEAARELAYSSLNHVTGDATKAFFYNVIASSYFTVDLEKMMEYANKSLTLYSGIASEQSIKDMRHRFERFNMIHQRNFRNHPSDSDDPLSLYIEAKMDNDNIFTMLECLSGLVKQSNYFLANMVKEELLSMGCRDSLIESIMNIKK